MLKWGILSDVLRVETPQIPQDDERSDFDEREDLASADIDQVGNLEEMGSEEAEGPPARKVSSSNRRTGRAAGQRVVMSSDPPLEAEELEEIDLIAVPVEKPRRKALSSCRPSGKATRRPGAEIEPPTEDLELVETESDILEDLPAPSAVNTTRARSGSGPRALGKGKRKAETSIADKDELCVSIPIFTS